jgi:hypothetical protein
MSVCISSYPPVYQPVWISDCLPVCVPVCIGSLAANLPVYMCLVHVSLSGPSGRLYASLPVWLGLWTLICLPSVCMSGSLDSCLPHCLSAICLGLWLRPLPICGDLCLLTCVLTCTVCLYLWLFTCPIACLDLRLPVPAVCLPVLGMWLDVAANLPSYQSGVCSLLWLLTCLPACQLSRLCL